MREEATIDALLYNKWSKHFDDFVGGFHASDCCEPSSCLSVYTVFLLLESLGEEFRRKKEEILKEQYTLSVEKDYDPTASNAPVEGTKKAKKPGFARRCFGSPFLPGHCTHTWVWQLENVPVFR